MIQTEIFHDNNTPDFLKGLAYAKNILVSLKKHKKQQLQLSPITRKHTKFSTEPIVQESTYQNQNIPLQQHTETENQDNFNETSQNLNEGELLTAKLKDKKKYGLKLKEDIRKYEQQINKIGSELEVVNKDIESYEVVFENLCDYYDANSHIVFKHNKQKKEHLRLQEQHQRYGQKIEKTKKQIHQIGEYEKKAKQQIKKAAQFYVRDVFKYNNQQCTLQHLSELNKEQKIMNIKKSEDQSQQEQEFYENDLTLRYRRLAQDKAENTKKKTLIQPKKLAKGISFQDEIDVVSKYYESQLTNI